MKCPVCGVKTKVIRTEEIGKNVYRIRICPNCGKIIKTIEYIPGEK